MAESNLIYSSDPLGMTRVRTFMLPTTICESPDLYCHRCCDSSQFLNQQEHPCGLALQFVHSMPWISWAIVKARVNNYRKVSRILQHKWCSKSLITISGEADTHAIEKSAKIGAGLV